MSVLKEFRDFVNKGNVVDLAVAVVIGAAFGKIVSAVVADLVMPLVNAVMPQGDWRKWEVSPLHFRVGDFLGTVVDFLIVSFVVFLVMVKVVGAAHRRALALRGPAPEPPPTKQCPECLETVPKAAKRCRACTSVLTAVALLLLLGGSASAQADPKFVFAKPEEVAAAAAVKGEPPVEWKAQIKAGGLVTTGNSQTRNATVGLQASRKAGGNKLALESAIAYGRSEVPFAVIGADGTITDIQRRPVVTTNNWLAKGRYDRFFTANNSGFAAAQAAADRVAGKSFFGGGQVGYSRQLLKDAVHLLVAEVGYDFSHERYVAQPMRTLDPVSIHSARLFAGETLKVSNDTGVTASAEVLFNLNKEANALNVATAAPGVDPFKDTRFVGKLGMTTTILKALSIAFGFTLRYDQNPAPLPVPSGSPAGSRFADGFRPFAEKVDTQTEATLIYTFL